MIGFICFSTLSEIVTVGLGDPDYHGPEKKINLGPSELVSLGNFTLLYYSWMFAAAASGNSDVAVGPQDTSEPVLVIPDVDMVGGMASGAEGIFVFSSGQGHNVTVMQGEDKLRVFGKCGIMEEDDMLSPAGVAFNQGGEMLVANHYNLKKFSLEGKFLGQVGDYKKPDDDATLSGPAGMTIGKDGRVYVVETAKNRVKIFNSDLSFHSTFSMADKRLGPGHLNNPMDVASNSRGEIFVADLSNNVIQVFSPDGEFLFKFGKQGHGLGCIQTPIAVAVDPQDYVYVASGTGSISVFEISGTEAKFVKAFGTYGAEVGKFSAIKAMHVDREGKLYVGEMGNKRIQVFE